MNLGAKARGVVLFVVLALSPSVLAAQTVQGHVLDAIGKSPIARATIELLRGDQGSHVVAQAVTDEQGQFAIRAPASGIYRLRGRIIGYQPVTTSAFDLLYDADPLQVTVHMSQVAVLLAPLTIISDRPARVANPRLQTGGYYEREHRFGRYGLGRFLDRDAILHTGAARVSDVFRMMPGVYIEGGGTTPTVMLRGRGRRCLPVVYVNGAPFATGADMDDWASVSSLVAVEVYPGTTTPLEFMRGDGTCGAIALWTGYAGDGTPGRVTGPPPASGLELSLTIPADSLALEDSVVVTLELKNLADAGTTLCIEESRYTLRGAGTKRSVAQHAQEGPCLGTVDLTAHASQPWKELVTLAGVHNTGPLLIQKELLLHDVACDDGDACARTLRSAWQQVVVSSATPRP